MSSIAPLPEQGRWLVETVRDNFEDVGADVVEVGPGASLIFYTVNTLGGRDVAVIYAPGTWLTVVPEETPGGAA